MNLLRYFQHYPESLQIQVQRLIDEKKLTDHLLKRYPNTHQINNDKALREYTLNLKNRYLKKTAPLNKVTFDPKIHVINNALGLHIDKTHIQGKQLKSRNEIRISSLFKQTPEAFLNMIVVHELAHLKEKDHNKAFYQLCLYMLPEYHQLECDVRLYLTHLDYFGDLYS